MLEKTVEVGGREVTFRASAAIPRIYRVKFKRDILKDMQNLASAVESGRGDDGTSTIPIEDLEIFENVAYIMALHADQKNTPKSIDDWLDQFEMFSIYEVLPTILELWGMNMVTTSEAKKKDVIPSES